MQPADGIKQWFENAKLAVDPDTDEQVFQEVLRAHQQTETKEPDEHACASAGMTPSLWRITMRSPITKLALAAVFVIVCLAGIVMWRGTGSSVALANVLTKIEQVTAYTYQMSLTMAGRLPGTSTPMNHQGQATILAVQDGSGKMTMDTTDLTTGVTVRQEMYLIPQMKMMLTLMPEEKAYLQVDLDDTLVEKMAKQSNNPKTMIQQILNCNYTSLGRSTVDGIQVEGFQTTDPDYLAGMMGQVDAKIWVDVKTQLPVRSELDTQIEQVHSRYVMDHFQWGVSVDPRELDPVIPADYKTMPGGPLKLPAISEQGAVDGLKRFADLFGAYPEDMGLMSLMAQMSKLKDAETPAAKQFRDACQGVTPEEMGRKLADLMLPVQMAGAFYGTLVKEKKEPAYYGETVTPQDVDKVLLRWRVSNNEYRVIFGSLHAETVKADVLAELEKDLPK